MSGQTMRNDEVFAELMKFQRDTEALKSIARRLAWDQETMMPRGSSDQRATEQAALVRVIHKRNTDPRIADWLNEINPSNDKEAANIRLIKKTTRKIAKFLQNLMPLLHELPQKPTAFGLQHGQMKMWPNLYQPWLKSLI